MNQTKEQTTIIRKQFASETLGKQTTAARPRD